MEGEATSICESAADIACQLSDRSSRSGFLCLAGVGYIILISSRNAGVSYFATYLVACGIYPTVPNIVAWVSSNVEGSYKRSVALGMVISFGNLQGAVSSNVVRRSSTRRSQFKTFNACLSIALRTRHGIHSGMGSSSSTSASALQRRQC